MSPNVIYQEKKQFFYNYFLDGQQIETVYSIKEINNSLFIKHYTIS
jgi:hypothetical protein